MPVTRNKSDVLTRLLRDCFKIFNNRDSANMIVEHTTLIKATGTVAKTNENRQHVAFTLGAIFKVYEKVLIFRISIQDCTE